MSDPHRLHQCKFCDTEGKYSVRLHIMMRSPGLAIPVKADMETMKVCENHKEHARPWILSEPNRKIMTTALTEKGEWPGEPDFLTAKIEFIPIKASVIEAGGPPVTCNRGDCTKPAKWQIERRFRMMWQKRTDPPMITALTNLCVCDEHKQVVRPEDFMDRVTEKQTRAFLNKHKVSMPDLKTQEVGFMPLDHGRKTPTVLWVGDQQPADLRAAALRKG